MRIAIFARHTVRAGQRAWSAEEELSESDDVIWMDACEARALDYDAAAALGDPFYTAVAETIREAL